MTQAFKIYGEWEELQAAHSGTISHDRMRLDARQLSRHWRRCSLSSDFWSRYTALSSQRFAVDPALVAQQLFAALGEYRRRFPH